ncbi:MAG: type II secretion system F family protein [Helicobacteraceae bacterium]|nr:type II secretion system F family protein [Helicobacteraceae bacterium]
MSNASNAIFEYEAIIGNSQTTTGVFKGTQDQFEEMLSTKKMVVTKVKVKKEKLDTSKYSFDDFLSFIEELYYLSNSGMSIDQSLKILLKTTNKESTRRVLASVLSGLKSGEQLSIALKKALEKENVVVDALSISFLSTAEAIGDISSGLLQLFEYLSFQKKVRSDVKQALSYPLFLIGMSIVVSLLIFFLIIPKFATIFAADEFDKLPGISYYVLSLGVFLDQHISEFLIGFFVLGAGAIFLLKTLTIPWVELFYRVPLLSAVIVDLQLSIVYRAMSTMLQGGLELDRVLRQMQKLSLLPELRNLLQNTLSELKKGQKLSDMFAISKIIPTSDIALLSVGENSATLDKVLHSLSVRHSEKFNFNVKKYLSILEPAIIVLLGVFISIIVVSIMMAVMSITELAG